MASDADTRVALEAVNTSLTLKVSVSEIQIFFFWCGFRSVDDWRKQDKNSAGGS